MSPREPLLAGALLLPLAAGAGTPAGGVLRLSVAADGRPVAANVFLTAAGGGPVRAEGLPFWRDHFAFPGSGEIRLAPGEYAYSVERGPEWRPAQGTIRVPAAGGANLRVSLARLADLRAEGWRAGETHVHRPPAEIPALLDASDLDFAQVITWWNVQNPWAERPPPRPALQTHGERAYHLLGGEDERDGGALLYFGLDAPLPIQRATRGFPPASRFLELVRGRPDVWVDVEKPFWQDLPLWLASGRVDTIGLAHNHMHRAGVYEGEAWGRARDPERYPGPLGNGWWTLDLYHHVLNCGLRIPPSAGSASGVLPNPVGHNRVYAHVGPAGGFAEWAAAVRAGRSFVTNGPLLRVTAAGRPPGSVFPGPAAGALDVDLKVRLDALEPVRVVEAVWNGEVLASAKPGKGGAVRLPRLKLRGPGWFLVRALGDNARTFRFASTAPYWVERPAAPRLIRRSSVRFFAAWLEERARAMRREDPAEQAVAEAVVAEARGYWRALDQAANAD